MYNMSPEEVNHVIQFWIHVRILS
uniref:Uncharacterized protein n=1 Tax=Arundo donax TaxID=35708 RepID=A0A0A9BL95_ARUDO